jgi:hypothetical protein
MTKIEALAKYLECEASELSESSYDENIIEHGSDEYLILTDEQADMRAYNESEELLWAFNLEYLSEYVGFDATVLQPVQEKLCEGFNPIVSALLGTRKRECIQDSIDTDGRGHTLSGYDYEELELEGDYYAYRIN